MDLPGRASPLYSLLMLAAILVGAILLRRSQCELKLAGHERLALGIGALSGATLGAKLPYVVASMPEAASGWIWFDNGKTILGGFVGGYLGVELVKWCFEIKTRTGDSFVIPAAVAIGIGRFACFIGGCCFGAPTNLPWGMPFQSAGDTLPRHPTQLYESAFHFAIALTAIGLRGSQVWRFHLIKAYLLAYLVFRFVTEFIRPEPRLAFGITIYQFVCLMLLPVFAALWWWDHRTVARARELTQPPVTENRA